MANIGKLNVDLTLNATKFQKSIDGAQKRLKRFSGAAKSIGRGLKTMGKISAAAGTAAAAGLTALYVAGAKSADELAKTSDKLGITTEALTGLRHAAELTGVSARTLDKSLLKMGVGVAEAADGSGIAADALEKLGISAKELIKLSPEKQFSTIADELNKVGNATEKTGIAYDIFGSKGVGLINTMALGAEGLAAARREAEDLGISISRVDAAKIEAANDSMFKMGQVSKGLGQVIASKVSPIITALSNKFLDAAKEAGGFGNITRKALAMAVSAIGFAVDAVKNLRLAWARIKAVTFEVINFGIQKIADFDRAISAFLDGIPGITAGPSKALNRLAAEFGATASSATIDFHDLAANTLNSDKLKAWVAEASKQADLLAEKAVAARTKAGAVSSTGGGTVDTTGADELERLRVSLLSQEDAISESYIKRRQIVEDNTIEGGKRQQELLEKLDAENIAKKAGTKTETNLESVRASLLTEEQALLESHERRKQIILDSTLETEEGKQNLLEKLTAETAQKQKDIDQEQTDKRLDSYSSFFGSMAKVSKSGNDKVTKISKAAALTEATIQGFKAIQGAVAAPPYFPYNLANVAAVTALQATNISGIAGAAHGGMTNVPKEATYLLDKGERVVSPGQNADLNKFMSDGGGGMNVVVNNYTGANVQTKQDGGKLIIDLIRDTVAGDMLRGGAAISNAMEGTYALNRGAGARR